MSNTSASMLTKDSPQQRRHPWTRVSWISGSDIEDLDEEEVQEVESITFGRALTNPPPAPTPPATTTAPSVIMAEDLDDEKRACASVTLKPFRFGTDESTTVATSTTTGASGSMMSPFCFPTTTTNTAAAAANSSPYGVPATTTTTKQQQQNLDILSQKGHLITPAVTDAMTEEEHGGGLPKKISSWKSFWSQAGANANAEEDIKKLDSVVMKEDTLKKEEEEEVVVNAAEEPSWTAEPEEEDEDEPNVWAAMARRLEAQREMAKGASLWVVDGCQAKWVSFGILMNTWLQKGLNATKTTYKSSTTKALKAWEGSSRTALMAGLGFLLVCGVSMMLLPSSPTPSPTEDLRDFVLYEKAHNVVNLKQIDDLNTEAFRTYARSTCVEAATLEQARSALDVGLYGVPDNVRITLVQMAVMEGVTQKNSIQDSNSDFVNSGKADAFMAFWSTLYDPDSEREAYKTCVMVTGVALTVAETIAEWTTKKEKYQIGTEPCHCGYVYCEECPVFDVREVKWPVFERRSLSLRKQEELRRWMVDQAIKSAEHLVLDGGSEKLALDGGSVESSAFAWTGQTSAAFFGEASHNDRVDRSASGSNDNFADEL